MKPSSHLSSLVFRRRLPLLFLLVALAACGGGAPSGASPEDVTALLTSPGPDPSQLSLSHLTVYVSGSDDRLHALRASDGYERWSTPLPGSASLLLLVNQVLFVNAGGDVMALRASDGRELWVHQDEGIPWYDTAYLATPTVVVYCSLPHGSDESAGAWRLHVLRSNDGHELWQQEQHTGSCDPMLAEVQGVLYEKVGGTLTAFQETSGKPLWHLVFAPDLSAAQGLAPITAPAVVGTTMYVNGGIDGVSAVDTVNRKILWHASLHADADTFYFTSVVVQKGIVYAGAGKTLYTFNAQTGAPLWQTTLEEGDGLIRPLVVGDQRVYVSDGLPFLPSQTHRFYALQASDGTLVWSSPVPVSYRCPPLAADGVLFLGDEDGTLHALRATDGAEVWHFARGDFADVPLALGA